LVTVAGSAGCAAPYDLELPKGFSIASRPFGKLRSNEAPDTRESGIELLS
jgi:hypothetical protein